MPIPYSQKQNKRPLGQELHIIGENHTIGIVGVATVLANMVKLVEVPRQDMPSSVSISGYTEVTIATPGNGQFYVDYVSGYITFNPSANTLPVSVTYYGRGSEIDAIDVDELQEPVGLALDLDGTVTPNALIFGVQTISNPSGTLPTSYVDNFTGLIAVITTVALSITLPAPTNTLEGRFFTVLNKSTSTQSIIVNGSSVIIGTGLTFLWDALAWVLVSGSPGSIPVVPTDPVSPIKGQVWFNSTNNNFIGYNGSVNVVLG